MAPLTGGKVLAIALAAFGVVIAVNVTLAVSAVRTFPGLEVKNSYVASQTFDATKSAQEALGWTVEAEWQEGVLSLAITDASGASVEAQKLDALVGWATSTRDDVRPDFSYDGTAYRTPLILEPGNWNIRLKAVAEDGTLFQQRIVLYIRPDRT